MVRTSELFAWNRVEHHGRDEPPPSCCQSMVQFDDRMYLFGGAVVGAAFNSLYSFDVMDETWRLHDTVNREVASSRMSHSTVLFEDSMIVFGGMDLDVVHGDLLSLNLRSFEWRVLPCLGNEHPGVRRSHAAATHGRDMYVSMGLPTHRPPDLWAYNFDSSRWSRVVSTQLFGLPPVSLHGHTMCATEHSLFIFGGCVAAPSGASSYSNRLYEFNIVTNCWTSIRVADSPMPSPRYSHVMGIVGKIIVIHGGDSEDCTKYYDDLWFIDLEKLQSGTQVVTWQKHVSGTRKPSARSGHCAAVFGDALYIFGGESPGELPTEVQYSNQLYRIPLTLSTKFPLTDLCARWLAKVTDVNAGSVPPIAASALRRYRRIEVAEKLTSFVQPH